MSLNEDIGRLIKHELPGPSARRLRAQRARLVELGNGEVSRSRAVRLMNYRVRAGVVGVLLVGAACSFLFLYGGFWQAPVIAKGGSDATPAILRPSPLTADIVTSEIESSISAPASLKAEFERIKLQFSDDTDVELEVGAQAKVRSLDERGLELELETGKLNASVTPDSGYEWKFKAGPYVVKVLGTVLSIGWERDSERLSVSVKRGTVEVTGGRIPRGRVVSAGESIDVAYEAELPLEPEASLRAEESVQSDTQRAKVVPEFSVRPKVPRISSGARRVEQDKREREIVTKTESLERSGWKELAQRGEYDAALQAAQAVGFGALIGQLGADNLLLLADTARYAHSPGSARRALLELRRRFPGHQSAQLAAFALGRLAEEAHGDDRQAAGWYRAYLKSGSNGRTAEGARLRLWGALQRLGDSGGARRAARDYLKHHPNGTRAKAARRVLSIK